MKYLVTVEVAVKVIYERQYLVTADGSREALDDAILVAKDNGQDLPNVTLKDSACIGQEGETEIVQFDIEEV